MKEICAKDQGLEVFKGALYSNEYYPVRLQKEFEFSKPELGDTFPLCYHLEDFSGKPLLEFNEVPIQESIGMFSQCDLEVYSESLPPNYTPTGIVFYNIYASLNAKKNKRRLFSVIYSPTRKMEFFIGSDYPFIHHRASIQGRFLCVHAKFDVGLL